LDESDFCRIGNDYGVEYLCLINVEKKGIRTSVWAQIFDLEKCRVIATGESIRRVSSDEEVRAAADEIVGELRASRIGKRWAK